MQSAYMCKKLRSRKKPPMNSNIFTLDRVLQRSKGKGIRGCKKNNGTKLKALKFKGHQF